jgi:hypothetical protein
VGLGLTALSEKVGDEATECLSAPATTGRHAKSGGRKTMSDMQHKAKENIANAADEGKQAADKILEEIEEQGPQGGQNN